MFKIYNMPVVLNKFISIKEANMLKHGQIKFTKKAAQVAEEYFKKKKIESFLVAIKRGE